MITFHDYSEFRAYVVAQDDDEDYQESGWVAVVVGDKAALAAYSHCSCFGTWESLTEKDGVMWDWEGDIPGLIALAQSKADPAMPGRSVNHEDYDVDHLLRVYQQVLEWAEKEGHMPKTPAVEQPNKADKTRSEQGKKLAEYNRLVAAGWDNDDARQRVWGTKSIQPNKANVTVAPEKVAVADLEFDFGL